MALTKPSLNIPICIAICLFAIGSWIDVNGLWVELPLLVHRLPEGWDLPSYLSVIIQLANLGPIAFTIGNSLAPKIVKEVPVIFGILAVGAASCLLLSFFWDKTTTILGQEHSTALLVLAFFLAFVDCTSSVAFLTFMATFKEGYMTPFYIGEGLSGLLPSLVALAQGAGEYKCLNQSMTNKTTNETKWAVGPKYEAIAFPVQEFFYFLAGMLITSIIAFSFLAFHPYTKRSLCKRHIYEEQAAHDSNSEQIKTENEKRDQIKMGSEKSIGSPSSNSDLLSREDSSQISTRQYILLLIMTAWICGINNGVLPSIQTYASLPYGQLAYSLALKLSSVANPLACFISFFLSPKSVPAVGVLTFIGTALAVFQITAASMSPTPPLYDSQSGVILIILVFIFQTAVISYTKVLIAIILRDKGRKALLWCGAVTQAGSAIGALTMFFLVNLGHVFKDAGPCDRY